MRRAAVGTRDTLMPRLGEDRLPSEAEKSEIWDRFEAGESQRSISRRLGRSPSTVRTLLVGSCVVMCGAAQALNSLRSVVVTVGKRSGRRVIMTP